MDIEVTDSVTMDCTDSVESDSCRLNLRQSNRSVPGLFSNKLQAPKPLATGFGSTTTFTAGHTGGFKLGPLQSKTTCECGLSLKTGKGTTLTQAEKINFEWKIGSGFVERTHPYASEVFKWKVGDQDAQIGEMLDLKKRETGWGFSKDEYQINLEQESTVYYKLKKINFVPVFKGCYESEAERQKSFSAPQCPTSISSRAREFARAGFFYAGMEDTVKCFACGVAIHQCEHGDDIRRDHIKWTENQNCPHMRKTFPELF